MSKDSGSGSSLFALGLRLYGLVSVIMAVGWLAFSFTLKPGMHGILPWTLGWWVWISAAVLGVCVIFLLRWAVVVFTVLLALQGLSYFVVYLVVGFRAGVILAIFALLAMLPSYLTYRAWHSLR